MCIFSIRILKKNNLNRVRLFFYCTVELSSCITVTNTMHTAIAELYGLLTTFMDSVPKNSRPKAFSLRLYFQEVYKKKLIPAQHINICLDKMQI